MITAWYPPLQSVAVNRMSAFVNYLDKNKFSISVITSGTAEVHGETFEGTIHVFRIKPKTGFWKPKFNTADSKLVHYSKVARNVMYHRLFSHADKDWIKEAVDGLKKLHKGQKIDLVISSFSPVEPHLAALEFCNVESEVKWIVDMRDEMSQNPQDDPKIRKKYALIEAAISKRTNALISVSEPIVDYFKLSVPGLKHYLEIRNGYDHEMPSLEYNFNDEFTMLHAGSFYGVRKPNTLFAALENLDRKNLLPQNWKMICAGASHNFSIPAKFKDHVQIIERVPQIKSIELMARADLNLLIQPPTGRKGIFTGKIFDYLSVGKPILAIADNDDVAAQLIQNMHAGFCANFNDLADIEKSLVQAIDMWKNKIPSNIDQEEIKKLHRKYQVEKLQALIEQVIHE
ncbi:MAG: hypothetical protein IPH66_03120 [Crocinitomicaceae bacterium]|nr:hypothetical protein [Crocinitomicaceae bacterium]